MFPFRELCCRIENISALRTGRNSCYRSADILVRLGLANAAEADIPVPQGLANAAEADKSAILSHCCMSSDSVSCAPWAASAQA